MVEGAREIEIRTTEERMGARRNTPHETHASPHGPTHMPRPAPPLAQPCMRLTRHHPHAPDSFCVLQLAGTFSFVPSAYSMVTSTLPPARARAALTSADFSASLLPAKHEGEHVKRAQHATHSLTAHMTAAPPLAQSPRKAHEERTRGARRF